LCQEAVVNNAIPNTVPGGQAQQQAVETCRRSDGYIVFGVGVVMLIFGRGIFGFAQAPLVGLALIIFSHYLD
jgi:hypothetical protein